MNHLNLLSGHYKLAQSAYLLTRLWEKDIYAQNSPVMFPKNNFNFARKWDLAKWAYFFLILTWHNKHSEFDHELNSCNLCHLHGLVNGCLSANTGGDSVTSSGCVVRDYSQPPGSMIQFNARKRCSQPLESYFFMIFLLVLRGGNGGS